MHPARPYTSPNPADQLGLTPTTPFRTMKPTASTSRPMTQPQQPMAQIYNLPQPEPLRASSPKKESVTKDDWKLAFLTIALFSWLLLFGYILFSYMDKYFL